LHVKSARLGDEELPTAQEDWEGGFTLFLNKPLVVGQKIELELLLEGDFMYDSKWFDDCHYPRSNSSWFPRHGYLDRATFHLTFKHPKRVLIASGGLRLSESPDPEDKNVIITKYEMNVPVPFLTFALAPFERHEGTIKWDRGGTPTPLEFDSLSGRELPIDEKFLLEELNNSVRYFAAVFGEYPYPKFGAAFHPFSYGLGMPTLLLIPNTDRDNNVTFQFIAHETAHQWWGNIVAWRSYRDQWLSEGFAEYSGTLYTGLRMNREAMHDLLRRMRNELILAPETQSGYGKGRLVDVGPIILGHRLSTSKTLDAYQTLIYAKGALVLRMIHFMLSDPGTGDPKAFFDMMTDFVNRYRNKTASTDDFRAVVNEHFAKSQLAQTYRIQNLNWLFKQYVYEAAFPSYELRYKIEDLPNGQVMLSGTIVQENAPADWAAVLPVKFSFGGKDDGVGTVLVVGPSSPFKMQLPKRPKKVELDPDRWIISEKVSEKSN
jgi:aminopeptidase N